MNRDGPETVLSIEPLFVEVTFLGGHRDIWPLSTYLEMPSASLSWTHARLVSREEVIRQRAQVRK